MNNCYGHYPQANIAKCRTCQQIKWCREAGDPPMLLKDLCHLNDGFQDEMYAVVKQQNHSARRQKFTGEVIRYSRKDLLEVIAFMLNLNPLTLKLLSDKIGDPDLNFSGIARSHRLTRQAIHQAVRRKILENPELATVLDNREKATAKRKQNTFLEAVCQIRRKTTETRYKMQENVLIYYKSLICWNRNFDLSKMSTLRGSRIFPADLLH